MITIGDAILYLRTNNSGLDKGLKDAKKAVASEIQSTAKAFTAGLGVVVASSAAVYKTFITPIIDYNKEILDAARSTRMSTEELSRFVQVGDDVGVSIGSITGALQLATKNGFAPTLESLGNLADKANAIQDPTERAAMLAKILGKNWAALDPILQLGKKRILELAASQADGLVVTEAEIKKTEQLRLRIDALTDTWIAYRNEIGLGIMEVVDLNVRATELTNTWAEQRLELEGQKPTLIEYVKQWHLIEEALRGAQGIEETGIVRLGQLKAALDLLPESAGNAAGAIEDLTSAQLLRAAAEALIAGDNKGAASLLDLYRNAMLAEDKIKAVMEALMKSNGMTSTMLVNVITSYTGAPGGLNPNPTVTPSTPANWKKDYPGGWIQGGYIWTSRGNTGRHPYAQGGHFIVPPGYDDNYPINVDSGEEVIIKTKEQQKAGVGGRTYQYFLTAQYGFQSERSLRDDVRVLELLHG